MKLTLCVCFALANAVVAQPAYGQFHITPTPPRRPATTTATSQQPPKTVDDTASRTSRGLLGTTPSSVSPSKEDDKPETPPRLDLFGGALSGVSSDHAYVRIPIVRGLLDTNTRVGQIMFEFSGTAAVSPKDTLPGVSGEEFQRRANTIIRLINNGGAATARLVAIKEGQWGGGHFARGANVDVGIVDKSTSTTSSQRGTAGIGVEGQIGWDLLPLSSQTESPGTISIGTRAGIHALSGSRLAEGMTTTGAHFIQFIAQLRKGDKILFGITYTTGVTREVRKYIPAVQFTLGAGPSP